MGSEQQRLDFQALEQEFDKPLDKFVSSRVPATDGPSQGTQDGVVRVAKVRVRVTARVVKANWIELALQMRLDGDSPWLNLTPEDTPLLVARRFSGKNGDREVMELYGIAALKRYLGAHGATVFELAGSEGRTGDGVNEWRYWAHVGARLSVAVQANSDGTVALLGLD